MCFGCSTRGHRGGLVSEVAVPGRTAHEGKPASHRHERAFAPSPSGRCGHARSVPLWARSTAPSVSAAMPEAFTFLADAELRPNYQTSAAAWEFAHQMQESCITRDAFSWPDGPARG